MKYFQFTNDRTFIFKGFYESFLYNSDTDLYLTELLRDSEHDTDFEISCDNYKNYELDVCKLHADLLNDFCVLYRHDGIMQKIRFKKLWSPKYYNYDTDRLQLSIDFNLKKLKDFCLKKNRADFNDYLKENYTSYDGYMSFIDNNVYTFETTYKKNDDYKKGQYISVMIEYYMFKCIFNDMTVNEVIEKKYTVENTDYFFQIAENITDIQIEYATPILNE